MVMQARPLRMRVSPLSLLVLCGLVVGCAPKDDGDETTGTGTGSGATDAPTGSNASGTAIHSGASGMTTGEVDCGTLAEAECDAHPGCNVVSGTRWDAANACKLVDEYAGCREANGGCSGMSSFARDPNGVCWHVNIDCIPDVEGWESTADNPPPESWNCPEDFDTAPECP
jgi:hypothetical protein